jgi:hypothetical protein
MKRGHDGIWRTVGGVEVKGYQSEVIMDNLKKYLLCLYSQGGYPEKDVGNCGEVEEYGRDPKHAIERAKEKYGSGNWGMGTWQCLGEIK